MEETSEAKRNTMRRTIQVLLEKAMLSQESGDVHIQNEANAWQAKAESLMNKYNIHKAECILKEKGDGLKFTEEESECLYQPDQDWESYLGLYISKAFDCHFFTSQSTWLGKYVAVFTGRKEDVANCVYFFDYLQGAISSQARVRKLKNVKLKNSFGRGAGFGLKDRLKDLNNRNGLSSEVRDLILFSEKALMDFIKQEHPGMRTAKAKKTNFDLFNQGVEYGKKVGLHQGVENGQYKAQEKISN